MIGFFCKTTAKSDEEYIKDIKKKMKLFVLVGIVGIATMVITELAVNQGGIKLNSRIHDFYLGAQTGIIFAAIILWIKHKYLLTNKDKLKESRLNQSDERVHEIREKSFKAAAIVLLVSLYGIIFIAGIFYPILIKFVVPVIFLFLISYGIFYKIYEKRM